MRANGQIQRAVAGRIRPPTRRPQQPIGLVADDLEQRKQRPANTCKMQRAASKLDATLEPLGARYIEAALELSAGNVSQAARRLGINRTTLYNRMEAGTVMSLYLEHFGLREPPFRITPHTDFFLYRRQSRADARRADLRHHPGRRHRQGHRRGRQRQDHALPHAA
jgi:DNA-binding phage protein